jgi:protein-S-isoprenylcysteine O-methyltransferase Ste14
MEKSVKRVSIWKPLVLSVALLLSSQQKVYAQYGYEEEEEEYTREELVGALVILAVIFGAIGLIWTTVEAGNSGSSSDTPSSKPSSVPSGASYDACAYARTQADNIMNQCVIRAY